MKILRTMTTNNVLHELHEEDIDAYLEALTKEGKSVNTLKNYRRHLMRFIHWCTENNIIEIQKATLESFQDHLKDEGCSKRTMNSELSALNGLFKYLGWYELHSSIKRPDIYTPKSTFPEEEECDRIVFEAYFKGKRRSGLLIEVFHMTGIRVSEITSLTVEAVKKGEFVAGEGSRARLIPIPIALQRRLESYIHDEHLTTGPVFCTRTGHVITRHQIWVEFKKLADEVGIDSRKFHPRNLRRLFAINYYNETHDKLALAYQLGVSELSSIESYIIQAKQLAE